MTRSACFGRLANGADDAEVAAAIGERERTDLALALRGLEVEIRPAPVADIAVAVGKIASIVGPDWTREGRAEFVALVASSLSELPGLLVLDALHRAQRRVTLGRVLLGWVCEDVEPKAAKLELERERLVKLAHLAASAA